MENRRQDTEFEGLSRAEALRRADAVWAWLRESAGADVLEEIWRDLEAKAGAATAIESEGGVKPGCLDRDEHSWRVMGLDMLLTEHGVTAPIIDVTR